MKISTAAMPPETRAACPGVAVAPVAVRTMKLTTNVSHVATHRQLIAFNKLRTRLSFLAVAARDLSPVLIVAPDP